MALNLALDTNRYTDFSRGDIAVAEVLETADRIVLPYVVLAELRAGFVLGRKGRENERLLQRFMTSPGVSPVYPDDGTTRAYASLYRQLREQGTPIPANDLWIAALVVQHNLTLYTRDSHFHHLPQLDVL